MRNLDFRRSGEFFGPYLGNSPCGNIAGGGLTEAPARNTHFARFRASRTMDIGYGHPGRHTRPPRCRTYNPACSSDGTRPCRGLPPAGASTPGRPRSRDTVPHDAGRAAARKAGETTMLGHYQIRMELGNNATGVIDKGADSGSGRIAAIEILALSRESGAGGLGKLDARFFRGNESTGRLAHPGIVTVCAAGAAPRMSGQSVLARVPKSAAVCGSDRLIGRRNV